MDFLLNNELIKAIIIILAFFLGSYLVTFLMSMLEKATSKSDTDLDDKIIAVTALRKFLPSSLAKSCSS